MPYYFYDATYILVLIGALISMFASWNVQNTFRAYSRAVSYTHLTLPTKLEV